MADYFTDAAQESAQRYRGPRMHVGTVTDREMAAHVEGWDAAFTYLRENPLGVLQAIWEAAEQSDAPNASNGDIVIYRDSHDETVTVFRIEDADQMWRNPEVYRILTHASQSGDIHHLKERTA